MVARFRISPILFAASGAALGYYFFDPSFAVRLTLILVPVLSALVSFFRVCAMMPVSAPSGPSFRIAHRAVLALAAGLLLGLASSAGAGGEMRPGLPPENISAVSGKLAEDPRAVSRSNSGMGILALEYSSGGGARVTARGRLPVYFSEESLPRVKEFGRGCTIYVEGSMRQGKSGPYFRAVSVHITESAPPLERFRTRVRETLVEKLTAQSRAGHAEKSWSGLSLALLLGIRDDLDNDLSESYRNAGCSHVLALSGMHLAILSAIVVFLLKKPLGLRAAAVLGALFVIAYVFMVGPQPSLVRAAIMYLLGTLAVLGRLPREPVSLLGMSFIIQIAVMPETGTGVSFVLSYLALLGILIIGEALHELGRGKIPEALLGPLSASLGAFIMSAPAVVFWFGTLRPIGIAAGLVIVPLTTVFMGLSVAALVLNSISPVLGSPLSVALSGLYWLLQRIAAFAAGAPGIRTGIWLVSVCALGLFLLIAGLLFKTRLARNRIAPFA
jgi:competence protein ComEC